MQLHYTPRSHFSRKVRILLSGLGLEVTLVDVGNAAACGAEAFGGNPLMMVPLLRDGAQVVMDSDPIAEYLVQRHDPADRYRVLDRDPGRINLRTVMNEIMSAEAELILAARTGMDTSVHLRFDKKRRVITQGLDWLEQRADEIPATPDYLGFHLVCLWDHLVMSGLHPGTSLPRLAARVTLISQMPVVAATRPMP